VSAMRRLLLLTLLAVAGCGAAPSTPTTAPATTTRTSDAPAAETTTTRVGQPFRDTYTNGDSPEMVAEVTVTKLTCGIASIRTTDPPKLNRPESGQQFCQAWYTIKNVGRTPLNWTGGNGSMQVETDQGQFESDTLSVEVIAALAPKSGSGDPDPAYAGSELNPGKVGHSTQVWQVPKDATLVGLVFRHYPSSPPVVVRP
jgi:hypothetical protein